MKCELCAVSVADMDQYQFQIGYTFLSNYRKMKINRYKNFKDKKLCLAAGLLLKYMVQHYFNLDLTEINETDKEGKPFLVGYPFVKYNISHSGNMAMCAVSDCDIGCDIEEIREIPYLQIAHDFFTQSEYNNLKNITDHSEALLKFYKMWVIKESYIKLIGMGLEVPLNDFIIDYEHNIIKKPSEAMKNIDGYALYREYNCIDGYCCACNTFFDSGVCLPLTVREEGIGFLLESFIHNNRLSV